MISVLVAARNAETFVERKITNCLNLNYPHHLLEVLFFSDGSTDGTLEKASMFSHEPRIRIFHSSEHVGKIEALNRMASEARGEILLFTDVDAMLDAQTLTYLPAYFENSRVGGVCGRRVIDRGGRHTESAQRLYFHVTTWIQQVESRIASVTANEGKAYAIRRSLFRPIAPSVTDDLFVCLSVVDQGYRFVFRPEIQAVVPLPSKSLSHEIRRRRRIVATSLRGIRHHARLFHVRRTGFYAWALFVNKVVRRLMPIWLGCLLAGTVLLAPCHPLWSACLSLQVLAYGSAVLYGVAMERGRRPVIRATFRPLQAALEVWTYFVAGNWGTLLGTWDYLRGRRVDKWEPEKALFSQEPHTGLGRKG
jgi:cellulose synthase/poly-beta-1,6-N-acetylglucosamine synthase-like glycosyltransferase